VDGQSARALTRARAPECAEKRIASSTQKKEEFGALMLRVNEAETSSEVDAATGTSEVATGLLL
jgi:hypothetical protein